MYSAPALLASAGVAGVRDRARGLSALELGESHQRAMFPDGAAPGARDRRPRRRSAGRIPTPLAIPTTRAGSARAALDPPAAVAQRTRSRSRRSRRRAASVAVAHPLLAGLAHPWVEPQVGDELARAPEAADVPHAGQERRRRVHVDAGHRHQPAHPLGAQRRLREHAVDRSDLLVEEGDLAQAARDGVALVWEFESLEEAPPR